LRENLKDSKIKKTEQRIRIAYTEGIKTDLLKILIRKQSQTVSLSFCTSGQNVKMIKRMYRNIYIYVNNWRRKYSNTEFRIKC